MIKINKKNRLLLLEKLNKKKPMEYSISKQTRCRQSYRWTHFVGQSFIKDSVFIDDSIDV